MALFESIFDAADFELLRPRCRSGQHHRRSDLTIGMSWKRQRRSIRAESPDFRVAR